MNRSRDERGFSLIELIVVIAIVALLTAIALPTYTQYTQRAKFSKVMTLVHSVAEQTTVYYSAKGVFPTLEQLGYATSVGDDTISPDPSSVNSFANYIPYISVFGTGTNTCPTGSVLFYFAGITGNGIPDYMTNGASSSYAGSGYGMVTSADINGTIQNFCFYSTYDANNALASGNYINGCVNITDNPNYISELDALFNSC